MKYGFVIDNRKCIGCHACTVACKTENHVPLGVNRTWVKYVEKGTFPNTRRVFQVTRCNHCEKPPCVTICPVTAMYQRKDGIVDFNSERCIGCKACMQACPYDSIYIDPDEGTAAKCHFCAHRTEVGLEPACVVVCPEHAIIAGDLSDPTSESGATGGARAGARAQARAGNAAQALLHRCR
jgi:Fe-S-cluster-containing dehydrogenase component